MESQYVGVVENLRAELEQDRFERYHLAVVQGMAANPGINVETCWPRLLIERSFELALQLSEASKPLEDVEPEEPEPTGRVVLP